MGVRGEEEVVDLLFIYLSIYVGYGKAIVDGCP